MKPNKQIKNWWIDALMLVGYLFCFYLEFTGVAGHEWLGVGIGLLAIFHTWLHWDWVVAVTRRFFSGTGARSRLYYLVDILIVIGFVVILETGLAISTWLNLDIMNYVAWLDIHIYASYATLALLVLKVGIHWRWVVNLTGKIFASEKKPMAVRGFGSIRVPVQVNPEAVDRRRFLGLMGVVGLGSLLAVINVVRENSIYNASADGNASAMGIANNPATSTSQVSNAQPATQTTPAAAADTAVDATASVEPDMTALPTAEPTNEPAQETQAAVAACQVRCSKSCAFPGRCRRYVDQNGNGLCDLGECI